MNKAIVGLVILTIASFALVATLAVMLYCKVSSSAEVTDTTYIETIYPGLNPNTGCFDPNWGMWSDNFTV